jgi:hypothetical protein
VQRPALGAEATVLALGKSYTIISETGGENENRER